jgi:hypothetical protein
LAVSRATASADRLPAEPPETKHPPDVERRPASRAITRSTLFSAAIAPDASSQEMPWIETHDTSMSNSRLAFVGADGMKPRNRGLSSAITLGAITDVYTSSTSSGCRGASRISPSRCSYSSSAGSAPLPRGTVFDSSRFWAYANTLRTICSVVRRPSAWPLHSFGDSLGLAGILKDVSGTTSVRGRMLRG